MTSVFLATSGSLNVFGRTLFDPGEMSCPTPQITTEPSTFVEHLQLQTSRWPMKVGAMHAAKFNLYSM